MTENPGNRKSVGREDRKAEKSRAGRKLTRSVVKRRRNAKREYGLIAQQVRARA